MKSVIDEFLEWHCSKDCIECRDTVELFVKATGLRVDYRYPLQGKIRHYIAGEIDIAETT